MYAKKYKHQKEKLHAMYRDLIDNFLNVQVSVKYLECSMDYLYELRLPRDFNSELAYSYVDDLCQSVERLQKQAEVFKQKIIKHGFYRIPDDVV